MKLVMDTPTSSNVIRELTLDQIRQELDDYTEMMRSFPEANVRDVMAMISSFTSRAFQIRLYLVRQDNRILQNFRTKELDPFVAECDRQFKVWSRVESIDKLDWEKSRGQR